MELFMPSECMYGPFVKGINLEDMTTGNDL